MQLGADIAANDAFTIGIPYFFNPSTISLFGINFVVYTRERAIGIEYIKDFMVCKNCLRLRPTTMAAST